MVVKVDLCDDCLFVVSWSGGAIQGLLDLNDFHSFLLQFSVGANFFLCMHIQVGAFIIRCL